MALNWGGAIFVSSKSGLTVTDSTILNSTAFEGGVFMVRQRQQCGIEQQLDSQLFSAGCRWCCVLHPRRDS
eukprot:2000016-Prymnesium_polylepis.1